MRISLELRLQLEVIHKLDDRLWSPKGGPARPGLEHILGPGAQPAPPGRGVQGDQLCPCRPEYSPEDVFDEMRPRPGPGPACCLPMATSATNFHAETPWGPWAMRPAALHPPNSTLLAAAARPV